MAYEMVMPYHLHMPSYFLETFTEYPSDNNTQPFLIFLFCFLFMSTTQSVFARALANIRWYG